VGSQDLRLSGPSYANAFGEHFTVTKFRYYISHLTIRDKDERVLTSSDECYLVEGTRDLTLPVDPGDVASVSFLLGVDSTHTTGGTGDLDPFKGMYWSWNKSYVFARLEGQCDSSHAPLHLVTWDIGGGNARRTVTLRTSPAGDTLRINADVLAWFNAVHPVHISHSPVCHQPGALASEIADNYAHMFTVAP
jgi:hypothetical protein